MGRLFKKDCRGHTLLEMLAVFFILSIVTVMTATMVSKGIGALKKRSAAQNITIAFYYAKMSAIREKADFIVETSKKNLAVRKTGEKEAERIFEMPAGIEALNDMVFVFDPLGGSGGGTLEMLLNSRRAFTVNVGRNGKVSIVEAGKKLAAG